MTKNTLDSVETSRSLGGSRVIGALARIVALIALTSLCMFLPFLPGKNHNLAVTLSVMIQLMGFAGLVLVPIGLFWLLGEFRWRNQRVIDDSFGNKGWYRFVITAAVAS